MWQARIYVTPKKGILDPQGSAVSKALGSLGFQQVSEVRVGKYLVVKLEAPGREEAERAVDQMCRRLLANPVIEDYTFEIAEFLGRVNH
ncbi:MAG: phosphoribosylformylglycinamidine synthase subunit PurS [Firmicutes bacterium]|nr:phosphoribosylformylglycinamidine synthase subunit PurS [Bacillota bacterium]